MILGMALDVDIALPKDLDWTNRLKPVEPGK